MQGLRSLRRTMSNDDEDAKVSSSLVRVDRTPPPRRPELLVHPAYFLSCDCPTFHTPYPAPTSSARWLVKAEAPLVSGFQRLVVVGWRV
jgi:hypothetical protein